MDIKVSIIVPVFNGEKYIARAINSLLNQSLKEIEIIVIDDGSVDNTLAIMKQFTDSRIKLISKVNEGVSKARNLGISLAKGHYIGFLDADDYVNEDMYEELYFRGYNTDIICSNLLIELEGKFIKKDSFLRKGEIYTNEDFKKEVLEKYLLFENLDLLVVMNKLYKRELLIKNNILFDEKLALEEDGMFNLHVYLQMSTFIEIDCSGYYYLENQTSVTRDFINSKSFEKMIQRFNYDFENRFDLDYSSVQMLSFRSSRLLYGISILLYRLSKTDLSYKEKNEYVSKVITHSDVQLAAQNLNRKYIENCSKFEKVIVFCIKNRNTFLVNWVLFLMHKFHKMGLINYLKKLK